MKKIGLCFSGGSVKGYAHLGVYQALLDLEIPIYAVSGASAGALMAAFVADGWTGKELMKLLDPKILKTFFKPVLSHHALLSHASFRKFLGKHLSVDYIEGLDIPCSLQTSNIFTGEGVCRTQGNLIDILLASMAIPGIFKPVMLEDGDLHVDGGVTDNFPITALQSGTDLILGSSLASSLVQKKSSLKAIMQQSFLMLSRSSITTQYKHCDIVFEPLLTETVNVLAIRSFSKQQAEELYRLGYESVMRKRKFLLSSVS